MHKQLIFLAVFPNSISFQVNKFIIFFPKKSIFKWEYRKGWDILLKSFYKAFTSKQNVLLIILTQPYHVDELMILKDFEEFVMGYQLVRRKGAEPKVWISFDKLTNDELRSLYKAADCFVLPSRGEGWGRPYVEAMSMGLPVIATDWSGQTEYMNANNSFLVSVDRLVPVPFGAEYAGHSYAEPSVNDLMRVLREVYLNKEKAKEVGKNARKMMLEKYTPRHLGETILERIKSIYEKLKKNEKK